MKKAAMKILEDEKTSNLEKNISSIKEIISLIKS